MDTFSPLCPSLIVLLFHSFSGFLSSPEQAMVVPISDPLFFLFPLSKILFPRIFASLTFFLIQVLVICHFPKRPSLSTPSGMLQKPYPLYPLGALCHITLFYFLHSTCKYNIWDYAIYCLLLYCPASCLKHKLQHLEQCLTKFSFSKYAKCCCMDSYNYLIYSLSSNSNSDI